MSDVRNKKLGLALGGGGPRGVAHIGLLKALEEGGIKPDLVSGTSVGALVGALYSFGVALDEIKEYALNMSWSDITKVKLSSYALMSNENIRQIITRFIGEKNIEDAAIPLSIVTCDITSGDKVTLNQGSLAQAIMASSAIPGIFMPVNIGGRLLVDGGVVENVPISALEENGADIILACDLATKGIKNQPENIVDVINNAFRIMISHSRQFHTAQPDFVLKPQLTAIIKADKKTLNMYFDEGYETTKKNLDKIAGLLGQG